MRVRQTVGGDGRANDTGQDSGGEPGSDFEGYRRVKAFERGMNREVGYPTIGEF